MRKVVIVLALVLVASAAPAGTNLVRSHLDPVVSPQILVSTGQLQAKLVALYGAGALSQNQNLYVGANICLACHNGNNGLADQSGWLHTRHSQMLRRPMAMYATIPGQGVIANTNGAPN